MSRSTLIGFIIIIIGAVIVAVSLVAYREAGAYLTPKTISVSGYQRRDGTYVDPYMRRPPGGAIHDKPYEDRRFLYFSLMLMGGCLALLPISSILLKRMFADYKRALNIAHGVIILIFSLSYLAASFAFFNMSIRPEWLPKDYAGLLWFFSLVGLPLLGGLWGAINDWIAKSRPDRNQQLS